MRRSFSVSRGFLRKSRKIFKKGVEFMKELRYNENPYGPILG